MYLKKYVVYRFKIFVIIEFLGNRPIINSTKRTADLRPGRRQNEEIVL